MYCNSCGHKNEENAKFCQSCGVKIVKVSTEHKADKQNQLENSSSESGSKNTMQNNENANAGLGGWLVLVGLGLILNIFFVGSYILKDFPLLYQKYDIPGLLPLIEFEFIINIIWFATNIYLLYLYFKKNVKFPKYYIIYLIGITIFVFLDAKINSNLIAPTVTQQKAVNATTTSDWSAFYRDLVVSVIWVWYMIKSKRVKATFVKNK